MQDSPANKTTIPPSATVEYREFSWRWVWCAMVIGVAGGVALTVLLWGRTTADHRDAALFQDAKFNGDARFEQAMFNWAVSFPQATFARRAEFSETTFIMDDKAAMLTTDPADPQKVVAVDTAYMYLFNMARVVDLERSHTWPPGWQPIPNHLEPDGTALLGFNIKILLDDSRESGHVYSGNKINKITGPPCLDEWGCWNGHGLLNRQPTSPQPDPTPSTTISGDHSRRAAWRVTACLSTLRLSGRKRRSPRSPTPSTSGADRAAHPAESHQSLSLMASRHSTDHDDKLSS